MDTLSQGGECPSWVTGLMGTLVEQEGRGGEVGTEGVLIVGKTVIS